MLGFVGKPDVSGHIDQVNLQHSKGLDHMIRIRLALAVAGALAGLASVSPSAFAADANCPSATTPICRQWSCPGPITAPNCTCARWECAVTKDGDPPKRQSYRSPRSPGVMSR